MAQPLQGRVALVTGASRGIGRGVALCLAERGAAVVVNYRSHAADAEEVVQAIVSAGGRALAWQADVAVRDEVDALVQGTVEAFGRLDIAVANAAHSIRGPVVSAAWEDVLR
ncbi:MAG: SDR family NAD(P)-dependent oxidoreductase, partial [Anaerolineaceae bacterium]|nr:SDR family NAD(P)-dependent oxidoreductase [Anaerolineaceae bacterium]